MEIKFTIYFPNKEKFEKILNEKNISFRTKATAFIQWYTVDSAVKDEVDKIVMNNKFQEGMKDEFRWNGWTSWQDGFADRERLGRKHY
jgi:hypothetical protein